MGVRNNIGKIQTAIETISRRSELFHGKTLYGLGATADELSTLAGTADDVKNKKPNKDFIWGIHRWGTSEYTIGK